MAEAAEPRRRPDRRSRPQCWASSRRPTCRRRSSRSPSTSRWCTRPLAPTWPRARRGTHSSLTRGEVAMTTAKAWRQKGTGRARAGALGVPHRYGGGAAFGPKPRHYTFKVNRKARRRALRAALTVHAERGSVAVVDPLGFKEPSTKQAAAALEKWGAAAPDAGRARGRGGRGREELSQHPGRPGRSGGAAGVADVIGAASLRDLRAGAEGARGEGRADGPPPGDHPSGRLREELRADGGRQVHVPGPRQGPQDPDRPGGRGDLRRPRARRSAPPRSTRSRSGAACTAAARRSWKKAIVQLAPGERIELFEGAAVEG